jgi:hypothetical protein
VEALLPQSIVSSLSPVLSQDFDVIAFSLEKPVAVDEVEKAIAIIEEFSMPATKREIGELIAMVYAMTAQRNQDQITMDLAIASFGRRLLEYPADVVREAMNAWPDKSTWFPSWHDLKVELDWRNSRGKMKAALENKLSLLNKPQLFDNVRKF